MLRKVELCCKQDAFAQVVFTSSATSDQENAERMKNISVL